MYSDYMASIKAYQFIRTNIPSHNGLDIPVNRRDRWKLVADWPVFYVKIRYACMSLGSGIANNSVFRDLTKHVTGGWHCAYDISKSCPSLHYRSRCSIYRFTQLGRREFHA